MRRFNLHRNKFMTTNIKQNTKCDFCEEKIETIQEIIRNNTIRLVYPKNPVIEEHLMFITVRHIEHVNEMNQEEIFDLFQLINKINLCMQNLYQTTAFNLFVNDGKKAGQHVPHIHFHFFGRSEKEKVSPYTILNNPREYSLEILTDEQIQERVKKIKKLLI